MKKKLIVAGCSFTDMNYVSSINTTGGKQCDEFPTWGEILAKQLDMDLVCLAKNGAGQEQIYSSVQDYLLENDPKEIGLCIAGWSKCQRVNWQKKNLEWCDAKPNMYGHVYGWIKSSLRYQYAFQNLCEQHNIPYKHFQMISLFVDHIYEYEFKEAGGNYEKIRQGCVDVIKNSPQYKHMKNFIGWPIFNEEDGFVVADLKIHKNWGVEDRLANNIPTSTFNPANRDYDEKIYFTDIYGKPVGLAPKGTIDYDHVIEKSNPHPNKKGHEWLAKYIEDKL
jgi:hypothetical protein|tara:strand:- start:654 stop:1490 length:837 start_codon:yes stop_codon:yes gene_type:complete